MIEGFPHLHSIIMGINIYNGQKIKIKINIYFKEAMNCLSSINFCDNLKTKYVKDYPCINFFLLFKYE